MSKLLSTLLAGAAALALSGSVIAADQQARDNQTEAQPNATAGKPGQSEADRAQSPNDSATTDRQSRKDGPNDSAQGKPTQNQADQAGTGDQTGGNMSAKQKAYSADLKKCDSMKSEQKSKCLATAKKKHGPMAQQTPSGSPTADQQTRADGSNDSSAQGATADSQATQSGNQAEQAGNQASQSDSNSDNTTAGRSEDQTGGDLSTQEKQYSADLKKCDSLTSEQQQKCIATAKKKQGQM